MLGVVCALFAALVVAACGSSDGNSSTSNGGGGTAEKGTLKSMLFVNPLPDNPQWRTIGDQFKKYGEAHGIKMTESGPTDAADPTRMIQLIQQGIAAREDAIVTYPASPAFGPVLRQAEAAGIVTGTIAGTAETHGQFNIGADFEKIGALYVEALADRPGPQRVGLIAPDPTGAGKAWIEGFKKAAAKTDNVTVAGIVYTQDDPAKALSQANALLAAHPDITVLASSMGTATTPSVSAIKSKGLKGRVVMLANGAVAGGVEGAREGIVYRFLQQNAQGFAENAIRAATAFAAGRPAPSEITIEAAMVSLEEYDRDYKDRGWI